MIDRCYNPKCKEYKYYGLLGRIVDERWHSFDNFLKEIELIDGCSFERDKAGELILAKDIKERGNKVYSLDKCKLHTREENYDFVPCKSKKVSGIDPTGKADIFFNQSKFAQEHTLISGHITAVFTGEKTYHKNWVFITLQQDLYQPVENPCDLYTPHYVANKKGVDIDYNSVTTKLLFLLQIPTSVTNFRTMHSGESCYGVTFKIEKPDRFDYTYKHLNYFIKRLSKGELYAERAYCNITE
ncbi:putative HTH homing endonuclease [Staphylococcus phage vB_SauH_DELF3]|nr:putative HTH homing endonuclease [Staphylococcus phage vB_SauH_DELF3]